MNIVGPPALLRLRLPVYYPINEKMCPHMIDLLLSTLWMSTAAAGPLCGWTAGGLAPLVLQGEAPENSRTLWVGWGAALETGPCQVAGWVLQSRARG